MYWGAQAWTQYSRCISPGLMRAEWSPPSVCWRCSPWWDPGGCLPSLTLRCTTGSWSAWCPLGIPGFGVQSCFQALLSPACSGRWSYSCSGAGRCTSPQQISWGFCQPISFAFWSHSRWQQNPLVQQSFFPFLKHLQNCWGCTLSHPPSD